MVYRGIVLQVAECPVEGGRGPNFGGLGFELKVCAALGEGGGVDVCCIVVTV